jgi:hypothetical protein
MVKSFKIFMNLRTKPNPQMSNLQLTPQQQTLTPAQENLSRNLFDVKIAGTQHACDELAVKLSNQGVETLQDLSGFKSEQIMEITGLNMLQTRKLIEALNGSSAPAPALALEIASAKQDNGSGARASAPASAPMSQVSGNGSPAPVLGIASAKQDNGSGARASAPASAPMSQVSGNGSPAPVLGIASAKQGNGSGAPASALDPANVDPFANAFQSDNASANDTSSLNQMSNPIASGEGASASDKKDAKVSKPPPTSHKEAVLRSPEAFLASRIKPSSGLLGGSAGKSDSRPECHSGSSVGGISPFVLSGEIDGSPVDTTRISADIRKLTEEIAKQSSQLHEKKKRYQSYADHLKGDNSDDVQEAFREFRKQISNLEKEIGEKKGEVETHRKSLVPPSADLSAKASEKYSELRGSSNPNLAIFIGSIEKLMNHLNDSKKHLKSTGNTTNSPTVTVYPNEGTLPKGLTNDDVVRLDDVLPFLRLNQFCKSVKGYTLFFYVTSEKERTTPGRQFVNLNRDVCPKGTFPTRSDFKRWILHFVEALEQLVKRYNNSSETEISLNDALVNKKLFNEVFSSKKPESFVRRRHVVEDMFANDRDEESQVSSKSVPFARGGGSACASDSTRVPIKSLEQSLKEFHRLMQGVRGPLNTIGLEGPRSREQYSAYQSIKNHPDFELMNPKMKVTEYLEKNRIIQIEGEGKDRNFTVRPLPADDE